MWGEELHMTRFLFFIYTSTSKNKGQNCLPNLNSLINKSVINSNVRVEVCTFLCPYKKKGLLRN